MLIPLIAASFKTYTYDNNGNCTSVKVNGQTTTPSFDIENKENQHL